MQVVISADYLMASAFCDIDAVQFYFDDLLKIRRSVEVDHLILLEQDALGSLSDRGMYPSAKIFKSNLPPEDDRSFGENDIARIVNYILLNATQFSGFDDVVAEWEDVKELVPFNKDPARNQELQSLLLQISLIAEMQVRKYGVLHFCDSDHRELIDVEGRVVAVEPSIFNVPKDLKQNIPLFKDYLDYLTVLDATEIFSMANDADSIKWAIYVGVLLFRKECGSGLRSVKLEAIKFGPEFIKSLKEHGCYPGQEFSGVCFDVIVRLIAGRPKNELSEFNTSESSKVQRTRGSFGAWRTHITKGNPALRLMCWIDNSGNIELANVGNKKECVIL